MAATTRTGSLTRFGVDVALWTIGSTELAAYLTDASAEIQTAVADASSIMDTDGWSAQGPSVMTLDMSTVAISTAAPLLALAVGATPSFDATLRHAVTGSQYANTAPNAGKWLVTGAKFSCNDSGAVTESLQATLQGEPAHSAPAKSSDPTARTTGSSTAYGNDVTSLAIGSGAGSDLVNFFDSFDVDVSIALREGHAALDGWQWPKQGKRTVKLNASRLVEAPASSPAASLYWMEMARARTVVAVSIVLGDLTIGGNARITNSKWSHGGEGAQKETISLEGLGAFTLTVA